MSLQSLVKKNPLGYKTSLQFLKNASVFTDFKITNFKVRFYNNKKLKLLSRCCVSAFFHMHVSRPMNVT